MKPTEMLHHTKEAILQTDVAQYVQRLLHPEQFAAAKESLLISAREKAEQFRHFTYEQSQHGINHKEAREKHELADHAEPHFIRQSLWADQIVRSPELHITNWEIMQAFALFADNHDANQLDIAHKNLSRGADEQLNPRNGRHHEVAGSLQLLAQVDGYQKATGLSAEQAKQIVSYGALMTLFHDSQDILKPSLQFTLNGHKGKPYKMVNGQPEMLHGDELYALFTKDANGNIPGCDFLSLSPKQLVELTRHFKSQSDPRFVTDATPFGLDEDFESHHSEALKALEQDDTPLFANATSKLRKEFVTAEEANVLGDQLDAIVPAGIGLLRTLSNGHARTRPLYDDATGDYLVYTTEPSPKGDTDLARKLREVLLVADVVEGSQLAKTKFVREQLPAMQEDYIHQLKKYGTILMSGDRDKIEAMVRGIWEEQLLITAQDLLHKANMDIPLKPTADTPPTDLVLQAKAHLLTANQTELWDQLDYLSSNMDSRITGTMEAIMDPRKYTGRDMTSFDFPDGMTQEDVQQASRVLVAFSPERIKAFQAMCDEVLYGPAEPTRYRKVQEYGLPSDPNNPDVTKGNRPRSLIHYRFAHPFFSAMPSKKPQTQFPYRNYLRP